MDKRSLFYIIIAGISWGTAGIFVNALKEFGFSSLQIAAIRNIMSTLMILAFVMFNDRTKFRARLREILLFALSGLMIFATSCFYYVSMAAASISTAVVLMYIAPVIVAAVSIAFFGEKFTWLKAIAIVCTLIGCGLVTGIIGGMRFSIMGIISGVLSGIAYSTYSICVKVEMRRGNDAITATAYCFLTAGMAALFFIKPAQTAVIVAENAARVVPLILGTGFFTGVFPYFMYTLAMQKLPAGVASAMATIEPMTATIIGVLVYGEQLGAVAVCGIVLIIGSVIALSCSE